MEGPLLGKVRAYWLGAVVCMAGFLFGYDSGIVGGVLTLKSFMNDYRYGDSEETRTNSLSVGLQQLGAFVACFFAWPMTNKLGRRVGIMISSFAFCIGAMLQTINTHSVACFMVGRVIAGLGLGASTVIVPMFNSEMTPKELRGQIGSFFQLFFTFGIFTSYWIDYGIERNIASTEARQWQIPIGLQILPAAMLGLGMLTVKESTRWLTSKGRHEEAWESLKWVRADDSPAIVAEMDEIRLGVEMEVHETEGFRWKELLRADNFKRILAAFAMMLAQQATGATAFAYYGPQYFKLIVGDGEKDLLLTAIFGAIKVAACGTFVLFVAERVSRRGVLIGGAAFMAACQIAAAIVVKLKPPPSGENPAVTSAGIGTIALIYLFVIAYNFSWGPLPWPYVSEIFPMRIREAGVAIGVSTQWLFNFVFSLTTPYMIKNMGWGTFLLWGVFDIIIAAVAFFFMKETRGLSLETIAHQKYRVGHGSEDEIMAHGKDIETERIEQHGDRKNQIEGG